MAEYILDVSPRGDAAGLLLGAAKTDSFGLVVLPKPWRGGPPKARVLDWAGGEVVVRCHEGDQVIVRTSRQPAEAVLREVMNNAGGREVGGLVAPGSFSDRHVLSEAEPATGRDFADLAGLVRIWSEQIRRGTGTGQLLHGPSGSPLLRPLLYSDFLAEVVGRLGNLRRGYEERSELLMGIRGRPNERSLQRALAQGSPRVECRFQEFTHETPLVRTLATALDVIIGDRGIVNWLLRACGLPDPSDRAVQARRLLFDVDPYPRAKALHVASTLNLARLDAPWSDALSLAKRVLAATGEESSLESATTSLRTVSLPTSRIWEGLVHKAFVKVFGLGRVENLNEPGNNHMVAVRHPWAIPGRQPVPDLVADVGDGIRLIVDAKYKKPRPTPSIDDQYQLFAYSHLVQFAGGAATHCVLAYPDYGPQTTLLDAPRSGDVDNPPRLRVLRLPFPSPNDVRNLGAWSDYAGRASAAVRAFMQSGS